MKNAARISFGLVLFALPPVVSVASLGSSTGDAPVTAIESVRVRDAAPVHKLDKAADSTNMLIDMEMEVTAHKPDKNAAHTAMLAEADKAMPARKTVKNAAPTDVLANVEEAMPARETVKSAAPTDVLANVEEAMPACNWDKNATQTLIAKRGDGCWGPKIFGRCIPNYSNDDRQYGPTVYGWWLERRDGDGCYGPVLTDGYSRICLKDYAVTVATCARAGDEAAFVACLVANIVSQ